MGVQSVDLTAQQREQILGLIRTFAYLPDDDDVILGNGYESHSGFRDAADYYVRASSLRVIARIRVPTLIIHASDDPIIPSEPFSDSSIADNPEVLLVLTARGGHVGFVADATEDEDRYWAENRVVEFCRTLADGGQK